MIKYFIEAPGVSSGINHSPYAERRDVAYFARPGLVPSVKMSYMLTDRPSYQALEAHYQQIHQRHLRDLFAEDPARGERMHAEAAGLYLDYSKNRITDETLRLLVALAEDRDLRACIDAMFRGDQINSTEKRSVLHTALRAPLGKCLAVAEVPDAGRPVHKVLGRMAKFANQ